jgi:translation initiation factor eIF-2B subunit alpha
LGQRDLPQQFELNFSDKSEDELGVCNPLIDYTPPNLITLLMTDMGILTPGDVIEHLYRN